MISARLNTVERNKRSKSPRYKRYDLPVDDSITFLYLQLFWWWIRVYSFIYMYQLKILVHFGHLLIDTKAQLHLKKSVSCYFGWNIMENNWKQGCGDLETE